MKCIGLLVLLLGFGYQNARADIASIYKEEHTINGRSQRHLKELKKQMGDKLAQRHVVYIAGFFHEGLPFQFIKNEEMLRDLGVKAITKIYPSSALSVSESSAIISERLIDLYFRGNEKREGRGLPIILIGHSKGGVEAILSVVQNPALVMSGIVEKVIGVQAAFETPLAELSETGTQLCEPRLSPCHFIQDYISQGLNSLRADVSHEVFDKALTQLKNIGLYDDISRSVFYVRGTQTIRGGMAPVIVPTHLYLNKFGPNDGLVNVEQQLIYAFGNDLGIMNADHAELFIHTGIHVYGEILLNATRAKRIKSFTRALMRSLDLK